MDRGGDVEPVPAWAPGWYPDPWAAGSLRWWDGRAWTSAVAPSEGRRSPRAPWPGGAVAYLLVMVVVVGLLLLGPASVADQRCGSPDLGHVDGWPGFVVVWLGVLAVALGALVAAVVGLRRDRSRRRPWTWSAGLALAVVLLLPVGWFLGWTALALNCGM